MEEDHVRIMYGWSCYDWAHFNFSSWDSTFWYHCCTSSKPINCPFRLLDTIWVIHFSYLLENIKTVNISVVNMQSWYLLFMHWFYYFIVKSCLWSRLRCSREFFIQFVFRYHQSSFDSTFNINNFFGYYSCFNN